MGLYSEAHKIEMKEGKKKNKIKEKDQIFIDINIYINGCQKPGHRVRYAGL